MSFKALSDAVVGLCQDVFGTEVTYTPNVGSPQDIKGVFDNQYVEIEGVVLLKPTLRINLGDLDASPAKGDEVTIDSEDFRVMESREDAYGGTNLILQRV